jgi:RNA polymerase II subunit A small phosphatase-like protein
MGDSYHPPPPVPGKKTLVLDLDQTLIYAANFPPHPEVQSFHNPPFYIFKRPGLDEFLKLVESKFDVFVFTHGEAGYARPVISALMPWLPESHRLYRDLCDCKSGPKKKLSLLGRKPTDLILVDDSSSALENNPRNTLQIAAWLGMPRDRALIDWLPPILQSCSEAADVRKEIKKAMFPGLKKSGKSIPIIL